MWFPIPNHRQSLTNRGTPTGRNRRRRLKSFPVQPLRLETLEARELLNGSSAAGEQLQAAYGQIPLSFEANQGQTDAQVRFLARGQGYGLFLTGTDAVLSLAKGSAKDASAADVLDLRLQGANPNPQVAGEEPLAGVSNYFRGNDPAQWHTNVATYGKVRYRNVYPGIDLVYYGNQRQLEYDFVVSPGADPGAIHLAFEGAQGLTLTEAGDLVLHTSGGDVVEHAPVLYQDGAAGRVAVAGRYVLTGADQAAFQVGGYDRSRPLVIDPVLGYSTYLGGNGNDAAIGIAVDSAASAYIVGETSSSNFPTTNGAYQTTKRGSYDAFVAKLNPSGTALVYATYIGGGATTSENDGSAIAVDSAGNAYITGTTFSSVFPTTPGAYQTTLRGVRDAFVTKLNAAGNALVYSTYLGGTSPYINYQGGAGIALDSAGNAYVTGSTDASDFPTTANAYSRNFPGVVEVFMTKLNASGSGLLYSTLLGGAYYSYGTGISVDSAGSAYITGETYAQSNFPATPGAFQPSVRGNYNAFVTKINPNQSGVSSLVYSTFLGGTAQDNGFGVAVDQSGNAYIIGAATSANFPTTAGAFQTSLGGSNASNAFVTKLNASGTALLYSTYLGGNSFDQGYGIALDSRGNAYVTGRTSSTNFPTIAGALQATKPAGAGLYSGFVSKLNATGTGLLYSTYLGGNQADEGIAIAVDAPGNAYVTGSTSSADFPTTAGAFQTTNQGGGDAFVAKIVNYPTHFAVSAPASTGAGDTFAFNVTALDAGNNPVTNYTGTVHISSTDTQAQLPADYTFTPADNGSHAFVGSLRSAGGRTVRVSDTTVASVVGQAVTISEYGGTSDGPAGITFRAQDHNYWFTEYDAGRLGYITPNGTVTDTIVLPAGTHPSDIFAAPNGLLYFFQAGASNAGIGTYDPTSGQYTPHSAPGAYGGTGLALGSDGNIWFTEYTANKIARLNPTNGQITEFTVSANSGLNALVAGPGGNLWFTEAYASKIGRITPTGTDQQIQQSFTEFAVPTRNAGLYGITVGPDGNLWYAEISGGRIGRITPTGTAVDFLPPTANSAPDWLTTGPDGNLWFADRGGWVGQITPSGLIAEFPVPVGSGQPARIATGPDGNLWFTAVAGNKLGRLTPTITVTPAPPVTHFAVAAVTGTTAGSPFSVTVVALDANNNVVPAYAGKVHFASSDAQAGLPADYSFTPGDRGIHTFSNLVALRTAGYQTLTVTDTASSSLAGAAIVSVSPASASTLVVSGFPSPTTAGVTGMFTVTAKDAYANVASGYTGTIRFSTGDPIGMLPAAYTFQASDHGVHTFSAILETAGPQSLRVTDTAGNFFGEQTGINVVPGPVTYFVVGGPAQITAGFAFTMTVEAHDRFANLATNYRGTVQFSSQDTLATLPHDYTFTPSDQGFHSFPGVVLRTAGRQVIVVNDGAPGGLPVDVQPAAASRLDVSGFSTPITAGMAGTFRVVARDPYGNVVSAYAGTVHFSSSDGQAQLPANATLTNGIGSFPATLKTAGIQSLTATDTMDRTLTGSQGNIEVDPAAAQRISLTALPPAVLQGTAAGFTATVRDAYNNVVTSYRGTVRLTSTDPNALGLGTYTFTAADAGMHAFRVAFLATGSQSVTVVDIGNAGLTANDATTVTSLIRSSSTYAAGPGPASLVAADLNGDGVLDLVMVNPTAGSVTILLGNPDGTFQPALTVAGAALDPEAVAVGDFNGDGIPDLAVADAANGSVNILLGNGDGTFQAPVSIPVGGRPRAITAVDLNGDGILDLVTANRDDNSLSVLLGNGDGTFQAPTLISGITSPAALAVADLNGDGIPDLVVTNGASANQVSVLLGVGDGTFQDPLGFNVGTNPVAVAVADLNGDGIPDLVTANQGDNSVSVLRGIGDGTFAPAAPYAVGAQPSAVAVGDLNGDGIPDLVVTAAGGNTVSIYLGVGDGTFNRNPLSFAVGRGPTSLALGDFNRDGLPDLAVANGGDNNVSVLLRAAPPTGGPDADMPGRDSSRSAMHRVAVVPPRGRGEAFSWIHSRRLNEVAWAVHQERADEEPLDRLFADWEEV